MKSTSNKTAAGKFTLAALFLILLSAICVSPQTTPDIRNKTFERIWKTIDEKFWDPTFGDVDWKGAHDRYAPQLAALKSDKEFYDLMNKMLGELKTSHMGVISPDEIAGYKK